MRVRPLLAIALALGCRAGAAAQPADVQAERAEKPPEPPPPAAPPAAEEPPPVVDEAVAEREQYDRAIATAAELEATCARDPDGVQVDALLEAYGVLAPYEQSPERDAAIRSLERCRQAIEKVVAKSLPKGKEPDTSAELEAAIRKANARSTKNLTVTVEGSKVTIHKKGKTGKKKKDEKKALDGYCAMTSAPTVTRITVITDEHGELSCSPQFEFSKQSGYVDRRLGVASPFEIESTEKKRIPPPR